MAYVVRKPGSNITEAQVIDFIAKQAMFHLSRNFKIVMICLLFLSSLTYTRTVPFSSAGCAIQENSTSFFYRRNPEIARREDSKEGACETCSLTWF